jgi:hypothetical protein
VSLLESWIPVGETMHIVSVLGIALDTALKTELEATGTLTGDNATLWVYIKNASAWYSYYESVGFIRTKTTNKGITQGFSDNSSIVPLDDYKVFKQDILDKANFFRNKLIDFLNNNRLTYPLYRSDDCDGLTTKEFGSGIYV